MSTSCNKKSCENKCICLNRNYSCNSSILKIELAKLNKSKSKCKNKMNEEEERYECLYYNGSYTKGLNHNSITGHLQSSADYKNFVCALINNNQQKLSLIPMAPKFELKMVDPLGSLSSPLIGADKCFFHLCNPPTLHSKTGAAEMIELYSMALTRDMSFINYNTNPLITTVLKYMNNEDVLKYLQDYSPKNIINSSTIFRGPFKGDQVGPYISQLLYLNIPMGALTIAQIYEVYISKEASIRIGITNEWGRNNTEIINIQNTYISRLPPLPPRSSLLQRYIFNGRSLAETVHSNPVYQFYYHSTLILNELGALPNPTLPQYPNQKSFIIGGESIQCMLGELSGIALEHAWYWKWQVYRKLRPEVFGLWIDNIKNNRVSNDKYGIEDLILNNAILNDIKNANSKWGFTDSYTLSLTYREGSPLDPTYPSSHAVVSGACCTLLKIFYDSEQLWSSLPGLSGNINRRILPSNVTGPLIQADELGERLVNYTGTDAGKITIYGEINKLASNIGFGRSWAGVNYRTDVTKGILLGEEIAIEYMKDKLSSWVQNNLDNTPPKIKLIKLDGTIQYIKPRLCKKK